MWINMDFRISTLFSKISLWFQGCPFGQNFKTSGRCHFKARNSNSIRIGKNVSLLAHWRSNRVGLSNPLLLQTFGDGVIEIGDFSGGSAVIFSSRSKISIGKHVNLGGNTRIFDHDFHPVDPMLRRLGYSEQEPHVRTAPVEIEDDVFVGANVIILKGVKLGARSIVAAGAVVFKGDYPPDSLLVGNPAKIVSNKK